MTWAIILGGSSGLGLATARKLAVDGYKLCVVYRESRSQEGAVRAAMDELESVAPVVVHFNVDAVSEAGRKSVLAALESRVTSEERVGVLVHSIAKGALKALVGGAAGSEAEAGAETTPVADGGGTSATGLRGRDVLLTVEAMGTSLLDWVSELRARNLFAADTRVLAFTSEGSSRVWPSYGAVAAAKATLESLIRAIAFELGPHGVRANCIQAGITDTRALRLVPGSDALKRHAAARNPLGRLTEPEDVANAVSLLCKPEARWINGTTLVVDGGEHLC